MNKEEHNKIIDFVNSDDYMLLNSYISKPYEETIIEQDKEIERLNNIINKLEKYLKEKQTFYGINQQGFSWGVAGDCLKKLKELKEGK